jgi:glucose-1-phosphate cytidylyltransferase
VLQPGIAGYVAANETLWEHEPMERLAAEGELFAYRHESFWHSMDTMRDVYDLERMWASGKPPWKVW